MAVESQSTHRGAWITVTPQLLFESTVCLILFVVSCAGRTPTTATNAATTLECGHVEIKPTSSSFKDALGINYLVKLDDDRHCVPASNYAASVKHGRAVELRAAAGNQPPTETLNSPLVFERVQRWREKTNPFGGAQLLLVADGGPSVYEVPPGDYRLVLKYKVGSCVNRRSDTVCVARSDPFRLEQSVSFVEEQ